MKSAYPCVIVAVVLNLFAFACSRTTAVPRATNLTSVKGRLILPPGSGTRGIQVIGTIRFDEDETADEWLILDESGGFNHEFHGELIGLRVTSGIEAEIISFAADKLPVADRAGQIDFGNIDIRDEVVEHILRLQMDEGLASGSIRIGMWFGAPAAGVSLGSRQFPVIEIGSTMRWLIPRDATDIYFLVEHPSNPRNSVDSWRSGVQQRFGPFNSASLPESLILRSK